MSTDVVVSHARSVVPDNHTQVTQYQEQQRQAAARETGERQRDPMLHAKKEHAHFVAQHVDADGIVSSDIFGHNAVLSHGYQLPKGVRLHAAEAYRVLEAARDINLPQSTVTAFFEAYVKRNGR